MTFRYTFAYTNIPLASRSAKNQCHSILILYDKCVVTLSMIVKRKRKKHTLAHTRVARTQQKKKENWYDTHNTKTNNNNNNSKSIRSSSSNRIKWMPLKQNVWPIFQCVMMANGCVVFKCVSIYLYMPLTRWTCFQFYSTAQTHTHTRFFSSFSFSFS